MRRLRYHVAASLDGYIAGPNGEDRLDPGHPGIDFTAMWAAYDTLVMGGRRTTTSLAAGGGFGKNVEVVVCSTTLDPAAHKKVTVVKPTRRARPRAEGEGRQGHLAVRGRRAVPIAARCRRGRHRRDRRLSHPARRRHPAAARAGGAGEALADPADVYQASGIVLLEYAVVR